MSSSSNESVQRNVSAGSVQIEPPEAINDEAAVNIPDNVPPVVANMDPPQSGTVRQSRSRAARRPPTARDARPQRQSRLEEIVRLQRLETQARRITDRITQRLRRRRRWLLPEAEEPEAEIAGNRLVLEIAFNNINPGENTMSINIGAPSGVSVVALNRDSSNANATNNSNIQ